MIVLGLTGGIACGKSTVSSHLRELGAPIVDADAIAIALAEKGQPVYNAFWSISARRLPWGRTAH